MGSADVGPRIRRLFEDVPRRGRDCQGPACTRSSGPCERTRTVGTVSLRIRGRPYGCLSVPPPASAAPHASAWGMGGGPRHAAAAADGQTRSRPCATGSLGDFVRALVEVGGSVACMCHNSDMLLRVCLRAGRHEHAVGLRRARDPHLQRGMDRAADLWCAQCIEREAYTARWFENRAKQCIAAGDTNELRVGSDEHCCDAGVPHRVAHQHGEDICLRLSPSRLKELRCRHPAVLQLEIRTGLFEVGIA